LILQEMECSAAVWGSLFLISMVQSFQDQRKRTLKNIIPGEKIVILLLSCDFTG